MWFDPSDVTLSDLKSALDELELDGPRRHLMIELYFVQDLREWERPAREGYFSDLLSLPSDKAQELMRDMVSEGFITCSQNMKTGEFVDIGLSNEFLAVLSAKCESRCSTEAARHRAQFGPRPPTEGVKRRAHQMFEDTCELCGEKAVRGKDQHGHYMCVSRVKKDKDGNADNVTILCRRCSASTRGQDLPADCRTLEMLEIADRRGYEQAPRTATLPPKPTREVVVTAAGPISIKTRNLDASAGSDES